MRGPKDKNDRWRLARVVVGLYCVLTALAKLEAEVRVVHAETLKVCTAHWLEARTERWRSQASARLVLLSTALLAGRTRLSSLCVSCSDTAFLPSTEMSAAAAKAAAEAAEMAKCKAAIKEMLEVNNRPYNGLH